MRSIVFYVIQDMECSIRAKKECLPSPVDSIRLAVLTVSPNKQYLGILVPTMPATTGPVCTPDLISKVSLVLSHTYIAN